MSAVTQFFGQLGGARRLLCAGALVTVMSLSASACSIHGGYITVKVGHSSKRIGEYTPTTHGYLVVLYRSNGSNRIGVSQVLLDKYKQLRKRFSVRSASIRTLRFARGFCAGDQASRCRKATADGEWSDFHGALADINHRRGACLAITFRSGENWTYRNRTDENCRP